MKSRDNQLRFGRIVGFGLLAEMGTILLILLILTLHARVFAAGSSQAVIDDFARRVPAVVGPVAGVLFTFIAALRATRPLDGRFRTHGLLIGVVTAVLTFPGLLTASSALRLVYVAAMLLKLAAGFAAGAMSERKHLGEVRGE